MNFAVVWRKELTDHGRDRRSMSSALLVPLLGPVMFTVMFNMLAEWTREDKTIELPVVGAERAPGLISALRRAGVKVLDAPSDPELSVSRGDFDAVLRIPEGYAETAARGETADVQLIQDTSRNKARATVTRVRWLLEMYSGSVGAQRLLARGVSPQLARALTVESVDMATPARMAGNLLQIIPLFLVLTAFLGGMYVAIDATAGERERGSLEPLLVNPLTRAQLVLGKWLATVCMGAMAVAVCLGGYAVAVRYVPLQDLSVALSLDAIALGQLALAMAPLLFFASAAQMLLATFARSFKEAQTYLQLFMMLPMVPGIALMLAPVESAWWMFLIPAHGQFMLIGQVMRGEMLSPSALAYSAVACGALTAACLWGTQRLLQRERIVFGR